MKQNNKKEASVNITKLEDAIRGNKPVRSKTGKYSTVYINGEYLHININKATVVNFNKDYYSSKVIQITLRGKKSDIRLTKSPQYSSSLKRVQEDFEKGCIKVSAGNFTLGSKENSINFLNPFKLLFK